MMAYLMESVIIAFVMGGVFGAITALHLRQPERDPVEQVSMEKVPVKIRRKS